MRADTGVTADHHAVADDHQCADAPARTDNDIVADDRQRPDLGAWVHAGGGGDNGGQMDAGANRRQGMEQRRHTRPRHQRSAATTATAVSGTLAAMSRMNDHRRRLRRRQRGQMLAAVQAEADILLGGGGKRSDTMQHDAARRRFRPRRIDNGGQRERAGAPEEAGIARQRRAVHVRAPWVNASAGGLAATTGGDGGVGGVAAVSGAAVAVATGQPSQAGRCHRAARRPPGRALFSTSATAGVRSKSAVVPSIWALIEHQIDAAGQSHLLCHLLHGAVDLHHDVLAGFLDDAVALTKAALGFGCPVL